MQDWARLAQAWQAHALRLGVRPPDLLVLLPSARLTAWARAGWQACCADGWSPRLETPQTLAAALGNGLDGLASDAAQDRHAGDADLPVLTLDAVTDALAAQTWLLRQGWLTRMVQAQPPGVWRTWAAELVATAHELVQGAQALLPAQRAGYWAQAREALAASVAGPAALEAALARVALAWAEASVADGPPGDEATQDPPEHWQTWLEAELRHPARAVVVLDTQLGDAALRACARWVAASERGLVIDLDAWAGALGWDEAEAPGRAHPRLVQALDFEDEAQRCASEIHRLLALPAAPGELPVALVAQDRELVRRVRALLERGAVTVHDETGWTLSTTRVAATVQALLRLLDADARCDDLLDLLKAVPAAADGPVDELEAFLRARRLARAPVVAAHALPEAAQRLWRTGVHALCALAGTTPDGMAWPGRPTGRRSLSQWLSQLWDALASLGLDARLQGDEAGRQLLQALRLPGAAVQVGPVFARHAQSLRLDSAGFAAWVEDRLESTTFRPSAPAGTIQVLIAPLSHLAWRPVRAVVMPACDERRLGPVAPLPGWLTDGQRAAIGTPLAQRTIEQRHAHQLIAFGHLLRQPELILLRRRADGDEPIGESPLLARWRLWAHRTGLGDFLPGEHVDEASQAVEVQAHPVTVPRGAAAPVAHRLPGVWQATHYQDLRTCPYRFFAQRVLGLREVRELDGAVEKRDYGEWLHAVLKRFHDARDAAQATAAQDLQRLTQLAQEEALRMGLDEAGFWPYRVRFQQLAPAYLEWLQAHERDGARYQRGEWRLARAVDQGLEMRGSLDRVDQASQAPGRTLWILDYKAQRHDALRQAVREPLEDTQLAFYAALLMAAEGLQGPEDRPIRAAYLALDDRAGVRAVEHPEVVASARALLHGLTQDVQRLRQGHGMPALGEGSACDWCAVRGLCRRDHWAEEPGPQGAP